MSHLSSYTFLYVSENKMNKKSDHVEIKLNWNDCLLRCTTALESSNYNVYGPAMGLKTNFYKFI